MSRLQFDGQTRPAGDARMQDDRITRGDDDKFKNPVEEYANARLQGNEEHMERLVNAATIHTEDRVASTQLKESREVLENVIGQRRGTMPDGDLETVENRVIDHTGKIPLDGALGRTRGSIIGDSDRPEVTMGMLTQNMPVQNVQPYTTEKDAARFRADSTTHNFDPVYAEETRKMIQRRMTETTEAAKQKLKDMKLGEDLTTGVPLAVANDITIMNSKEILAHTSNTKADDTRPTIINVSPIKAVCVLEGPNVSGTIVFTQEPNLPTVIEGDFQGLTSGQHGLHIHTLGDTTNGCNSTGPHFNPRNEEHGNLGDDVCHVGDLGNVTAIDNGTANIYLKSNLIQLSGVESILGRALVIHADPDDLGRGGHEQSRLTGNAGARIACGIIGLQTIPKANEITKQTAYIINEYRENQMDANVQAIKDQMRNALETASIKAVCVLEGSMVVKGTITFGEDIDTNSTVIEGEIHGLRPGKHGLHIHALGDTTNGCNSTGPHFNPNNVEHGDLYDDVRHAGDLGNVIADYDGITRILCTNNLLHLNGKDSCLGRALVVHADPDDLGVGGHEQSKLTGNAGARLACGIIGLQAKA